MSTPSSPVIRARSPSCSPSAEPLPGPPLLRLARVSVRHSPPVSSAFPTDRVHFDALYGLQILEESTEHMRGWVEVTDSVKQPFGLVHGGVMASVAEALASIGTGLAAVQSGNAAVGMSNSTSFIRPILSGGVHADARPRHRGRSTWIWDVEITDGAGRLCAMSRVTIAVRPVTAGR